jgi:hypothetical protein
MRGRIIRLSVLCAVLIIALLKYGHDSQEPSLHKQMTREQCQQITPEYAWSDSCDEIGAG